jgi:hypothetical protein
MPWSSAALVVVVDEIGRSVAESGAVAVGVDAVGVDVVIPVAVVVLVVTAVTGAGTGVAVPVVIAGCASTAFTVGGAAPDEDAGAPPTPTTVAGTLEAATLYGCGYERHAGSAHTREVTLFRVVAGKLACFVTRVTVSAPPANEIAPACTPATQIAESSG